ncbi:MAG: replicative DNA helicase [candidate division Zixibacteria bacterium]|nr:replicative DNA helicase [candidate division Zixibacteria bacterium]
MSFSVSTDKIHDPLLPPQSIDAEQAVLGSILKDSEAINHVLEVIDTENYFYSPKHKTIFRAVLNLNNNSEPCDITTVANELLNQGMLEKIGGRVYLVELVEQIASTANVAHYASIVLEKSVLRRLIQTSNEIVKSCYSMERPADDLLDAAEANIFQISESRQRQGFVHIESPFNAIFERIDNPPADGTIIGGVSTGYTQLDAITEGLHAGDLVIIAGRPSMGKTALAMNIAEHVAVDQKKGVGIFSIEMSREQLVLRMLCGRARINQKKVRSHKISESEHRNLAHKGGVLAAAPIFIDDSAGLSSLEMRAKARRLKAQHNIGLFIVDYIQLMHASGRQENRQQEIALITRSMKALAKEIQVPVIAISQLSRMVEQRGTNKRPQLSDLRESGAIEQDADVVIFVYREEYYMSHMDRNDPKYREIEGKAEIIVAKQRNGPTETAHLSFIKEYTRFENLDTSRRELPPGVDRIEPDSPF